MRFPIARPPAYQVVQRALLQKGLRAMGAESFTGHSSVIRHGSHNQTRIDLDTQEYIENTETLDGEKLLNAMEAIEAEEFLDAAEDFLEELEKIEEEGNKAIQAGNAQDKANYETHKGQAVLDGEKLAEEMGTFAAEDFLNVAEEFLDKVEETQEAKNIANPNIIEDFSNETVKKQNNVEESRETATELEDPPKESIEYPVGEPIIEELSEYPAGEPVKEESALPSIPNKSRQRIFNQNLKQVTNQILEHSSKPVLNTPTSSNKLSEKGKTEGDTIQAESVQDRANYKELPSRQAPAKRETQTLKLPSPKRRRAPEELQELSRIKPYRQTQLHFLRQLYHADFLREEHFIALQKQALKYFNAESVVFLLWDRFQLVYRAILHSPLDDKSILHNFYFADADPFLRQDSQSQSWERENMLRDPHSLQRFGKSFLKEYKAVHILKIQTKEGTRPAFLMLLYKDLDLLREANLQSRIKEPAGEYMDFLEECIIPLRRLRERLWYDKINSTQLGILTREALNSMQLLSANSKEGFYALHFRLEGLDYEKNWQEKLYPLSEFLSKSLAPQEKLLIYNMKRILFLLQETDPNHIIKLAQDFCAKEDLQLYLSLSQYPKEGYNFYQYIEASI